MKKGYFVHPQDESWGLGVVATAAKEAKNIAYASGELIDVDWTDLRVRWERSAEVEEIPIGIVMDMRLGLLCGLYGYVEGYKCDECGVEGVLRLCNGKALCDACIEEVYVKQASKERRGERKMKRNKVEEIQNYLAEREIVVAETTIIDAAIKIATRWGGNAVFISEFEKVKKR